MLKNWIAVYFGNLIDSILLAWMITESGLFGSLGEPNILGVLAADLAEAKLATPFGQALIRGIFCNILVILANIMSIMAKDTASKMFVIIFPIATFVAWGFDHSIANLFLIPAGLLANGTPLHQTWIAFQNIFPVTIGNLIGGILILVIHPNRIRQIKILVTWQRNLETFS